MLPNSRYFKCYVCNHDHLYGFGPHPKPNINTRVDLRSKEQFYVKADGVVYGPATQDELCSWAKMGRLYGLHKISTDRQHWDTADMLYELDLKWQIQTKESGDTFLLNPLAVRELANEMAFPDDTTITDTQSGKCMSVDEAIRLLDADKS